jgi:hypothetical protein
MVVNSTQRNGRAVRGASDDDGWARSAAAGGRSTARKVRKYPRRKIIGVAEQDVAGFVKVVDLLECGHTNWPPDTRGAGTAAWTICEKCPPKEAA